MIIIKALTKFVPLQALNIFSTDFVIQYMSHLICRNLFARRTFVNAGNKNKREFVKELIRNTQPSSLQSAMERCQSISEGMNHSPFGTAAFACNEQFQQCGLTHQQAKTRLPCSQHNQKIDEGRLTLDRRDLKRGLRYSAD